MRSELIFSSSNIIYNIGYMKWEIVQNCHKILHLHSPLKFKYIDMYTLEFLRRCKRNITDIIDKIRDRSSCTLFVFVAFTKR